MSQSFLAMQDTALMAIHVVLLVVALIMRASAAMMGIAVLWVTSAPGLAVCEMQRKV